MTQIIESIPLGQTPTGKVTPSNPAAPSAPSGRTPAGNTRPGAPTDRTGTAQPTRSAPTLRTPGAADPDAPPLALNHARILYANALIGSTVSATGGTGAANVLNAATYSRWSFTGSQTLTITLPANTSIDAVGIGAHNFAAATVAIDYSTSDGGAWVSFAASQSGGDAMLFLTSAAVSAKRLRVTVSGSGALVLGVVYAGIALQMQRPVYKGHTPATLARETEYEANESEAGQWLGRNIKRSGLSVEFNWRNLSAAWLRAYFRPFMLAARTTPFFVAWNPQDYPRDVAYAWSVADIQPTNSGPMDLMSATLKAKGAA